MWKVVLTMKEQSKYEVIQQVGLGRKTKRRAAVELGLSVRQVDRLTHKYLEEGKQGLLHGNVGRAPSNKLSKPDADHIVNLFRGKYQGFNIRHFHEHLITEEEFTISETS
ncbi:helix-turn-helix domain-containing protein, partial [Schleiferilactobacillus harbinensis]